MITGATQTCFSFLNKEIKFPESIALDYNPHKLIKSNKKIKILWAHYAHDQPIFLNVDWDSITHIVCVSYWQRLQFERYLHIPQDKITVIRNGVAEYFNFSHKKEKVLIYASAPYRGLRYLLDIFPRVLRQHPDAKLHIFSGMSLHGQEDSDELKQLYDNFKKIPNTYFSKPIPHVSLAQEFQKATILAYPNTWEETSCVTLIEAMASGCYPVITDIGALPETAQGYGTIVPLIAKYHSSGWQPSLEFQENYANHLIHALNTYSQKDAASMSATIKKYYSWSVIAKEWQQLISKLTQGTPMSKKENSIVKLATQTSEKIVNDPVVLQRVFDEVFKWENEDKELAQGRSNFQIEKFIALDNYTVPSTFQAMLKNRRIMAEGLFSKITEMKEHQREFDYKWNDADREEPLEWFTKDGGKKLCWYDLDYLNLQNYLKSSELEIRDRVQQIQFFDKILDKLIDMNGGPITREQFENEDHIYWERRFANQAMDEMLSRMTGISVGNIHSIRRASAPTIVSDDVNRVKNSFPELGKALGSPEAQLEFIYELQKKVMSGIEDVTGEKIALQNEKPSDENFEQRLNNMNNAIKSDQKSVISPKTLFNHSLLSKK